MVRRDHLAVGARLSLSIAVLFLCLGCGREPTGPAQGVTLKRAFGPTLIFTEYWDVAFNATNGSSNTIYMKGCSTRAKINLEILRNGAWADLGDECGSAATIVDSTAIAAGAKGALLVAVTQRGHFRARLFYDHAPTYANSESVYSDEFDVP